MTTTEHETSLGPPEKRRRWGKSSSFSAALAALSAASMVAAYTTTSEVMVGIYSLGLMLTLIFLGAHVGIAMGLSGLYAIWVIHGTAQMFGALTDLPYDNVSNWSISVLPMFIFMGFLLWRSTLTTKLYDGAGKWLNWMPGGLAITSNLTCAT